MYTAMWAVILAHSKDQSVASTLYKGSSNLGSEMHFFSVDAQLR